MKKLFLIPKAGMIVRDPQTGEPLPPEGKEVITNNYWRRRINDADVTVGRNKAKSKSKSDQEKI